MTFRPPSLAAASEISPPHDVREVLREFAKAARKTREVDSFYPRRNEMRAMLTDARACIERINASS